MKVIRLISQGKLSVFDEPIPVPEVGEKLLKIASVGICGSDLHWFSETRIGGDELKQPLILGHEFSAITEDGLRVAVDPSFSCGKCEFCLNGNPNLCPNVLFAGHGSIDGALRQFMVWSEKCLFPIPISMSDEEGAMLEPLGVAIHAVDLAQLKIGMRVGIFGCGPIGLMILQLVKLSGALPIFVTDPLQHRLDAAIRFGAENVHNLTDVGDPKRNKYNNPAGSLDVAFEVAGDQIAVDDAINAVIPGGKVILVGIPSNDYTSINASAARRKGLTIKFVRRMKHTYPRAIDLVERNLIDVQSIITGRFPLLSAQKAFEIAESRDGLKIIINI